MRLGPIDAETERLDAAAAVATIDIPAIDWSWDPQRLNTVLRTLWHRIQLGSDLMPVAFDRTIPRSLSR